MSDKLDNLIDLFDKVLAPVEPTRDGAAYVWTFTPQATKDATMSDEPRDAFDDLHDAWTAFVVEVAKALRIPQMLDWLTNVIERYHV